MHMHMHMHMPCTMGSMAQTGLIMVPSDALGHTWALLGVLRAGQGLPLS